MVSLEDYQRVFCHYVRGHSETAELKEMQSGPGARSLSIYQSLVYNNAYEFLVNAFECSVRHIPIEQWHMLVRGFVLKHDCQSPYFRDIPKEFFCYLEENNCFQDQKNLPDFLSDLMRYELAQMAADVDPSEFPSLPQSEYHWPTEATVFVSVNPAGQIDRYDYPVHQLGSTESVSPSKKECWLFVFRHPRKHRVKTVALNPASALLLLETPSPFTPLDALLADVAEKIQQPIHQCRAFALSFLEEIAQQGAVALTTSTQTR